MTLLVACLLLFLGFHVPALRGNPVPATYYNASICSESDWCGGVEVRYPFYLANTVRAAGDYSCGYTDLKISCQRDDDDDDDGDAAETPHIQLGQYSYTVKRISYETRNLILVDADAFPGGGNVSSDCPNVRHNVSFGSDWLRYAGPHDNLTFFFGCRLSEGVLPELAPYRIACPGSTTPPGGGESSFVFSSDQLGASGEHDLAEYCRDVFLVPVLGDSLARMSNRSMLGSQYGRVVGEGFQLAWPLTSADDLCYPCEQSRGRCAYSQNRAFMGCLCSNQRTEPQYCGNSGASGAPSQRRSRSSRPAIIGGVAGGLGVLLVAGVIAFFVIRKRKQKKGINSSSKLLKYSGSGGTPHSRGGDVESGSVEDLQTHLFSYEELEEATDSFNGSRELGDGGFGTVYKGYLKDGRVVAVKRLYNNSYRRVEQFVNEAAILSRLRHPNLVMFYGCTSSSSRELLLVYEFVANGTVADHLHGHRAPERALPWPLRLSIAVESAAALTYLHAIEPPIVHRDVKTTNILLDADFHVKVADFGLSRLFPVDVTHVSTAPQGTPGYVDPEYHQCYQLTDKSDVYSFGVVLVELISSKPAVDITRHRNEINLAGMAIDKIQKCQLEQLVDLELGYESDPATKKMMTMVAELAFRCLQQNGEMRPPIKEVLEVLKAIQAECRMDKDGDKDLAGPFSPNTVHATWESRATTPNTSRD